MYMFKFKYKIHKTIRLTKVLLYFIFYRTRRSDITTWIWERNMAKMTENEKLENISHLKEKRNMMRHLNIYGKAIGMLEQLMLVWVLFTKSCVLN